MVIGPLLQPTLNTSAAMVLNLINGIVCVCVCVFFPLKFCTDPGFWFISISILTKNFLGRWFKMLIQTVFDNSFKIVNISLFYWKWMLSYDAWTRRRASDTAACTSVLHLSFKKKNFFFYGFAPTRLRFVLIPAELGRIGRIGSYRPVAEIDRNSQNGPTSALNHARTAEIGFEWGPNILNLSFLFFILNICYFFCIFFFVLCFLPSSFFVLWTKDI